MAGCARDATLPGVPLASRGTGGAKLHVLALIPYPTKRVPGQRYRIEQWEPFLAAEGIDIVFAAFLSAGGMDALYKPYAFARKSAAILHGYASRVRDVCRRRPIDVVLVYREAALLGGPWIERLIAHRTPMVFDFDDAIFLRDTSRTNAWSRILKSRTKTEVICRLARQVTVGNEFLAAFARRHASSVTVVPSTIDTELYLVRPRPDNRRVIVGWTGSETTLPYLKMITGALRRLRERHDFEFRVIGGQVSFGDVAAECRPWRPQTEADDVREFDIGLMPLPDDEWARGKCGLKALQYMALGIPPVVSPVGVNALIVRDGVNGFHARSEREWIDRIDILLRDAALRRALGTEARKTVVEEYSAQRHAPRMGQILREAARA